MTATPMLRALAAETLAAGRLTGLPDGHFIDGAFVPPRAGRCMASFDPGTGSRHAAFPAGDADDVADAVASSADGLRRWRAAAPADRGRVLLAASQLIRARADRLAVAETLDCGKPLSQAVGNVASAARTFEYYAGAADKLQGDTLPLGDRTFGFTWLEPVGITAHIVPWNYPISTLARSLAPALAAGCSAVVKPSELTPATALMLAGLLVEAGLPAGVCNVVCGMGPEAGAPLVADARVRHVTFTGSTATGVSVMRAAAANVTGVTLELGGKSPLVVMADADLDLALDGVLGAIFENAGQICSAGSRLVVEASIRESFLTRVVERAKALTLGHGLRDVDVGPVASPAQLARIEAAVEGAEARGADVLAGGRVAAGPETGRGWFYEPTVIAGAPADDPVVQEEIFGPVLVVQEASGIEEAVALANGTAYGLVAGIYTRDLAAALRFAREVEAGQVYLNDYFAGGIEAPFGGTKRSGIGREKGFDALRAYSTVKSVAGLG